MKNLNFKAYFAELLGTFLLVFAGTTVAVTTGNILYVALTFGLVVVAMAYSIGSISGAHLNPAVSLALAVSKRLSYKDFAFYTLFQVFGAILASGLLSLVLGSSNALAGNMMQAAVASQSVFVVLLLEALFVTFFVYVILTVTAQKDQALAGIIIALTLSVLILTSFNLTSAGLNPARSIAPALFEGGTALSELYAFVVGPFIGSIGGALLYKAFQK